MQDITDLENQLSNIEAEKQSLLEERQKLEAERDDWRNRLLPDTPLKLGFDDGIIDAPWRTKSDDLEDQIARIDEQLAALEDKQHTVQDNIDLKQFNLRKTQNELAEVELRQQVLQEHIDAGVPSDGPTSDPWLHNQLAGCTHYVSEKRDVYAWPNAAGQAGHPQDAKNWANQATAAGYQVGDRPVKGAIMVMNSDTLPHTTHNGTKYAYWTDATGQQNYVHNSAGHVAYVENVQTIQQDGRTTYEVTISEANTVYQDGTFVRGTHTTPKTRMVIIDPQTIENGVDFVYDQPPSTSQVS